MSTHKFWNAGDPECPREIKAPNGELHTLRCQRCGGDGRAPCTTEEKKFTRGDVVANDSGPRSTRGCPLVCGSGIYDDAIVVQGDPLVLVSREGDMMWSCIREERKFLKKTGVATAEESEAAFKRFERTPG